MDISDRTSDSSGRSGSSGSSESSLEILKGSLVAKDDAKYEKLTAYLSTPVTEKNKFYVRYILKNDSEYGSSSLVKSIESLNSPESIFYVALCLRYGADPNMYVNTESLGSIHILAYTYQLKEDKANMTTDVGSKEIVMELYNYAVDLLLLSGSDPRRKVRDSSYTESVEDDRYSMFNTIRGSERLYTNSSVKEWINAKQFDNNLDVPVEERLLEYDETDRTERERYMNEISVFLDRPSMYIVPKVPVEGGYEKRDIDELFRNACLSIRSFSDGVFSSVILENIINYGTIQQIPRVNMSGWRCIVTQSIDSLNINAFQEIVRYYDVNYRTINKLIKYIRDAYENKERLVEMEYYKFLNVLVDRAYLLDKEQVSVLEHHSSKDLYENLVRNYERPRWEKSCDSYANFPYVQKIAFYLDIDPTLMLGQMCDEISNISKLDPRELTRAFEKKQKTRMSGILGYKKEFLGDRQPILTPTNQGRMDTPYFKYNSLHTAYYRDEHDSEVYSFNSNAYDQLISTSINPYNQKKFPPSFLNMLKFKRDTLEQSGVDYKVSKVKTFEEALEELDKKDEINSSHSEAISNRLNDLLLQQKIKNFRGLEFLTLQQMKDLLENYGSEEDLEAIDSTLHRKYSVAHELMELIDMDEDNIAKISDAIGELKREEYLSSRTMM